MTFYAASHPIETWKVLFFSRELDELAEALAAQPTPRDVVVYATLDGHSRALDLGERIALFTRLAELVPGDAEAAAELAAAHDVVTREARRLAATHRANDHLD